MSFFSKLFGGSDKPKKNHTAEPPESIRQKIADGDAIMLDVRSQEEFDAGHLKDVTFIKISTIKDLPATATELSGLDKNKIIYCHWKAGGRATVAAHILAPLGYDVRTLPHSYEKMVELGFEPE